jgi:hypothetical protein
MLEPTSEQQPQQATGVPSKARQTYRKDEHARRSARRNPTRACKVNGANGDAPALVDAELEVRSTPMIASQLASSCTQRRPLESGKRDRTGIVSAPKKQKQANPASDEIDGNPSLTDAANPALGGVKEEEASDPPDAPPYVHQFATLAELWVFASRQMRKIHDRRQAMLLTMERLKLGEVEILNTQNFDNPRRRESVTAHFRTLSGATVEMRIRVTVDPAPAWREQRFRFCSLSCELLNKDDPTVYFPLWISGFVMNRDPSCPLPDACRVFDGYLDGPDQSCEIFKEVNCWTATAATVNLGPKFSFGIVGSALDRAPSTSTQKILPKIEETP